MYRTGERASEQMYVVVAPVSLLVVAVVAVALAVTATNLYVARSKRLVCCWLLLLHAVISCSALGWAWYYHRCIALVHMIPYFVLLCVYVH